MKSPLISISSKNRGRVGWGIVTKTRKNVPTQLLWVALKSLAWISHLRLLKISHYFHTLKTFLPVTGKTCPYVAKYVTCRLFTTASRDFLCQGRSEINSWHCILPLSVTHVNGKETFINSPKWDNLHIIKMKFFKELCRSVVISSSMSVTNDKQN